MSDGFTIGAAMGEPTIFDCPNCKETIDANAETCRFCGVKVDHEAARRSAVLLARVNQACSDASYLKSTALTLPVFFLVRFVPFIAPAGTIGFWGLLVALPLWALRWLLKYRGIETDDPEFRRARSTVKWTGIAVTGVLVLFLALNILFFAMARAAR
ncbi:MAG: hypothetical protein ACLQG3_19110 [Terracidiphilus sp.]